LAQSQTCVVDCAY